MVTLTWSYSLKVSLGPHGTSSCKALPLEFANSLHLQINEGIRVILNALVWIILLLLCIYPYFRA